MLMEECVRMRVSADFGEYPSIDMILTSFFLFACLFGSNQHKAARLRLREAIDLAHSLGIHLPQSYDGLDAERREQWLRTYLVLSVTERAYALQKRHSIDIRGRSGITARFMQAFEPNAATEHISHLIYQEHSDSVGMTGLLYLMDAFDAIDENVIECWNGTCKYSDDACDSFDRRRALEMFRAQQKAREASLSGRIPFAPSATPLPLSELVESQQADISVTQFWLLNRIWNLCLSHGLLRGSSDHLEMRYDFACHAAGALLTICNRFSLSAMEVHGIGLVGKIYDVAMGVIIAITSSADIGLNTMVPQQEGNEASVGSGNVNGQTNVRTLLLGLGKLIQNFRGGDHKYSSLFRTALQTVPGIYG